MSTTVASAAERLPELAWVQPTPEPLLDGLNLYENESLLD